MYTIYADDLCIYDDLNNQLEYRLISPKWHREDNTAGSLTFTLPPSNIGYEAVQRLKSHIRIYKNDVEVWEGRVISENVNFRKERAITCEGELAYLNDVIQPQREFINPTVSEFLSTIIAYHNSKVAEDKRFTLGAVTVNRILMNEGPEDEYDGDAYVYTNYESTYNCIAEKLINKSTDKYNDKKKDLKGHLRIRKENGVRYLDYLKDYPDTSSQVIEFGQNLMDFVIDYDESEFCTVLIPLGERYSEGDIDGLEGYLDITDVNDGKNYLESSGVSTYGRIERIQHFDDITDDEELKEKGIEYLADIQFGKMKLSVTAVDLSNLNVDIEEIKMINEVRVRSNPHGLDRMFPVTEIDMDLDNPGNTKYTFGLDDVPSTISTYTSATSSMINDAVKRIPSKTSILEAAKTTATTLIQNATNGYITITESADKTQELYITNTPNYTQATKLWRWNINGLGYSKDSGKSYGLAMTMDGSIVADFITTGTLNANIIRAGVLQDAAGYSSWNLTNGTLSLRGVFTNYTYSGYKSVELSDNMIKLFDWGGTHDMIGGLFALRNTTSGIVTTALVTEEEDNQVGFGYKTGDNYYDFAMWFSGDEIKDGHTPHVLNTVSGTIGLTAGGYVEVENGFVKDWHTYSGAGGTIFSGSTNPGITLNGGVVSSWRFNSLGNGTLSFSDGYWKINGGMAANSLVMNFESGLLTSASLW